MHKLGCPARNNPGYAACECAAMDQREHTEQLRIYNENAPRIEQLQAEIADLRERLERAEARPSNKKLRDSRRQRPLRRKGNDE